MRIKVEFEEGERSPSTMRIADAIVRFFFNDASHIEELAEYLLTWAKHNSDDGKRGDEG